MLVSIAEFRTSLGGADITGGRLEAAKQILQSRQQELEMYINRPLEPTMLRQVESTDASGFLYLRLTPVRQVLSMDPVLPQGVAYSVPADPFVAPPMVPPIGSATDIRVIDDLGPMINGLSVVDGGIMTWTPYMTYVITYVGGFDGANDQQVKNAIIEVASREYRRKHLHGSSTQGGVVSPPTGEADARGDGWTMEELMKFDRIKRRVIR